MSSNDSPPKEASPKKSEDNDRSSHAAGGRADNGRADNGGQSLVSEQPQLERSTSAGAALPTQQRIDFCLVELCKYNQDHPTCLKTVFNLISLGLLLGLSADTDFPQTQEAVDSGWSLWTLFLKWKELCKREGLELDPEKLTRALEGLRLSELSVVWRNILRENKILFEDENSGLENSPSKPASTDVDEPQAKPRPQSDFMPSGRSPGDTPSSVRPPPAQSSNTSIEDNLLDNCKMRPRLFNVDRTLNRSRPQSALNLPPVDTFPRDMPSEAQLPPATSAPRVVSTLDHDWRPQGHTQSSAPGYGQNPQLAVNRSLSRNTSTLRQSSSGSSEEQSVVSNIPKRAVGRGAGARRKPTPIKPTRETAPAGESHYESMVRQRHLSGPGLYSPGSVTQAPLFHQGFGDQETSVYAEAYEGRRTVSVAGVRAVKAYLETQIAEPQQLQALGETSRDSGISESSIGQALSHNPDDSVAGTLASLSCDEARQIDERQQLMDQSDDKPLHE